MNRSTHTFLAGARLRGRRASAALIAAVVGLTWTTSATAQFCRKAPCPEPDVSATEGYAGTARIDRHAVGLPLRQRGHAGGPADPPRLAEGAGGPCEGAIGVLPDHVISLRGDLEHLRLQVVADAPVALIVFGPGGWICSGVPSTEAALQGPFAAGTWRVWVAAEAPGLYPEYRLELGRVEAAGAGPAGRPERPSARPAPRSPSRPSAPETRPGARPERSSARPRHAERPQAALWVFQGRFEELDVRFEGPDVGALHAECTSFASRSNGLDWVDDIVVHGTAHRRSTGWWAPEALCAIAALNARPHGSVRADARAHGRLEQAPFEVHGSPDDLRAILTRFLPLAVDMAWADDLEVNGQSRRNRSGYWTLDEVVMLVQALSGD